VAAYRGLGGTPEAATLGTMARDAGASPGMVAPGGGGGTGAFSTNWQTPLSMGGGFSAPTQAAGLGQYATPLGLAPAGPSAGQAGLLRIANQNASMVPHGEDGQPTSTYSTLMDQIGRANTEAGMGVLGNAYGPGSDAGSWILKDYQQLIAQSGTSYFDPDDSRLLTIYQSRGGLSTDQARAMTHYANDYYKVYGVGMTPKQLDETLGQVLNNQPPDASKWTEGAKGQTPGYGTPGFKPPPAFTPPPPMAPGGGLTPPPAGGQPPPGGTPPPSGTPPGGTPPPAQVPPWSPAAPPLPANPPPNYAPPIAPNPPPPAAPGAPPSIFGPGSGIAPVAGVSATPKGWSSPEGYPAVTLGDGRAGYYVPSTGQVIDGSGQVLAPRVLYQGTPPGAQSGTTGQVVANPSVTQSFLAPSATGQSAQSSQQAATAAVGQPAAAGSQVKPDVKYTYDYLPGGKGLGYLGTDGKMFNTQWQPVA
jgi:hypothetical protein